MLDLYYGIIQYSYISFICEFIAEHNYKLSGKDPTSHRYQLAVFVGVLIPDPIFKDAQRRFQRVNWIWDQSLLTVELNTITRGQRHRARDGTVANGVPAPRSIVTDQQNLKAQGRTYLADGISLDVTCDLKGQGPGVWPAASTSTERGWFHMKATSSGKRQASCQFRMILKQNYYKR